MVIGGAVQGGRVLADWPGLAPANLLEGRDLIGQAPTGSGKTAAFGLGLLHRLDPAQMKLQALVLCPTRELADQVSKHIRKLATGIATGTTLPPPSGGRRASQMRMCRTTEITVRIA